MRKRRPSKSAKKAPLKLPPPPLAGLTVVASTRVTRPCRCIAAVNCVRPVVAGVGVLVGSSMGNGEGVVVGKGVAVAIGARVGVGIGAAVAVGVGRRVGEGVAVGTVDFAVGE